MEGWGAGVCVGVLFVFGVRLSFGRTIGEEGAGLAGLGAAVNALGAEGDRMRAVVDMVEAGRGEGMA